MAAIPSFVVEYFLLGRTCPGAQERYTQDGGIVSDVWLAFAADRSKPQRVLVAPSQGINAAALGHALHTAITTFRRSLPSAPDRGTPGVSPLENFVAVTLYFDELLRIVLPLTSWWHRKNVGALRRKAEHAGPRLDDMLERAILHKLGGNVDMVSLRRSSRDADRRVIAIAPLAALIGVFGMADKEPGFLSSLPAGDSRRLAHDASFADWVRTHAEAIAHTAREELLCAFDACQASLPPDFAPDEPPELVQRVFLDRKVALADNGAISTIKADAANRVFDISCNAVTWAIIDCGIDSTHPAFLDHNAKDPRGRAITPPPSRVRATYDFTHIERIANFDLTAFPEGSPERTQLLGDVAGELVALHGPDDPLHAAAHIVPKLELIAQRLEQQLPPDWNLIEPLIRVTSTDPALVVSDHGTHVAGILAGDWRPDASGGGADGILQGVCPDINLYDLRVIVPDSPRSSEFALIAAIEFVQFLNARAASGGPVVHGVNISLSIPHDVRNYGCGATPVCTACDRLSQSGVVVVAAAGNRGWNEQEIGFGNFVFCSITDPGNAREVITVGATHRLKPHLYGVSYFSSRGPTGDGRVKPDLVAPGEQVRGPIPGDADDELDGTSMAAPFVSGAAAMVLARHREFIGNPAKVKRILCENATDLGREKYFQGHGLVDVLRALESV